MIKPENDRKVERCHMTYFRFCSHGGVHFNKIGRLSVSNGDVDGRKVNKKNGFSLKKNHFTTQISRRFASYRHFDGGNSG